MTRKLLEIFSNLKQITNVYLHLPFCKKKCHFCAFPVHAIGNHNQSSQQYFQQYTQHIIKQIQIIPIKYQRPLDTLYIGGGTPSLFPKQHLQQLLKRFPIDKKTQITLQLNVEQLDKINEFHEIGMNRLSIGIQSFNKVKLSNFNRSLLADIDSISNALKRSPISNFNVDFIFELAPSSNDFIDIINFIKDVNPNHITFYMLENNQGSYIFNNKEKYQELNPGSEIYIQRYLKLSQNLRSYGYQHYQVSAFAKPGFHSKHNSIYWTGTKQYMAYGMGATSLTNKVRYTRPKTLNKYYSYVSKLSQNSSYEIGLYQQYVSQDDKAFRLQSILMSRLRTKNGLIWNFLSEVLSQQDEKQAIKELLCKQIQSINFQRGGLIKSNLLSIGIILQQPIGFLFADFISHRLCAIIQKYYQKNKQGKV